jgi:hypothetical protein
MLHLIKSSGEQVSFTEAELQQIVVQLAAAGQGRCSGSRGLTHVLVGPGSLLTLDTEWIIGRRLMELHSVEPLGTNPYGLAFSQGAAQRTLYEALLASGYVGAEPSSLAEVFMLQSVGNPQTYLEAGQLVASQGIFESQPAKLKTLVAGSNVALSADATTVTISATGAVQSVEAPLALDDGVLSVDLSDYATVAELAEKQNALAVEAPLNLTSDVLSLDVDALQAPEAGGGGRPLIYDGQVLRLRAGFNLYSIDQYAQNCLEIGTVSDPSFGVVTASTLNLAGVNVGTSLSKLADAVANPLISSVAPPLAVDAGQLSVNLSPYALDSDLTSLAADVAALETGKQDALTVGDPGKAHYPDPFRLDDQKPHWWRRNSACRRRLRSCCCDRAGHHH